MLWNLCIENWIRFCIFIIWGQISLNLMRISVFFVHRRIDTQNTIFVSIVILLSFVGIRSLDYFEFLVLVIFSARFFCKTNERYFVIIYRFVVRQTDKPHKKYNRRNYLAFTYKMNIHMIRHFLITQTNLSIFDFLERSVKSRLNMEGFSILAHILRTKKKNVLNFFVYEIMSLQRLHLINRNYRFHYITEISRENM